MPSSTSIPIIVQGNTFSLAIPLQIYVIDDNTMTLEDYTPDPTDQVSIQLKGSRRQYTYAPTVTGNTAFIDLSGNEMVDNYGVVVSIVKANGQRLRSFRTDQFFIVESVDELTASQIADGTEQGAIYLDPEIFIAGKDGRGIVSIVKTATSGLVDTYTITYTDNTTSTFNVTNGKDGINGQDGVDGADGVGIASIAKTGTQGLVDTYTITMTNGTTYTYQVTNGKDGEDGADGQDGTDGVGIVSITKTSTSGLVDTYTILLTNGTTTTFTVTNGSDATQVQSDWSQSDSTAVDFIKNKPTIPAAQVQSNWNESDTNSKAYIQNKPTIPAAQVQSDWNEASSSSKAYIQNKPTIPTKTSDLTNDSCPLIEDTRSSASDTYITGTAPFATLAGGQRIVFHFKYNNAASPSLQLTLSGGTTTSAYPLYQNYNNGVNALTPHAMPAGSYGEFVFDSTNSRWVLVGKDFNTTYSNTSQSDINNSAQGSRLIEPKLLRDNFYLKSEVNNICPIIEDTRNSNASNITGVAPFSTLVDKQKVIIHLAYITGNYTTLQLTLNDGVTTTNAIPIYARTYDTGVGQIQDGHFRGETYMELIYNSSQNRWYCLNLDRDTTTWAMSQSEINNATNTDPRSVPTGKLIHDNAYIVELSYTSGSLKANKMYDFGTVSTALTIPSLDATNDLVSNALNFYALRFIAGADNLSITFPTGVEVDDTPTINTGDYVEIMINLYVVNGVNNFYASIKVWQAQ